MPTAIRGTVLGILLAIFVLAGCNQEGAQHLTTTQYSSVRIVGPNGETGGDTIPVGGTLQFKATAVPVGSTTSQDVTSQATWMSSSPSTATVNSTGVATGVAGNFTQVNINASIGGATSNTFQLTVAGQPSLTGFSIGSAYQNQTYATVTLTGTGFVPGMMVSAPSGITVSNINVTSATAITASLAVGGTAATGNNAVMVSSPGGSSALNLVVNAKPSGPYLITEEGYDMQGPFALDASVNLDAGNNVLGGKLDVNRTMGPISTSIMAGTYSCDTNGLCILPLQTQTTSSFRLAFALNASARTGKVIEFDGATTGIQAQGEISKQNATAFSSAQINGSYGFQIGGPDTGSNPMRTGLLGAFKSTGACDLNSSGTSLMINAAGTVSGPLSFTGLCIGTIDPGTSRGVAGFNFGPTFQPTMAFYFQTDQSGIADRISFIRIDTIGAGIPLLAGKAEMQTVPTGGSFDSTALTCTSSTAPGCVAQWQGVNPSGVANADVALITEATPGVLTITTQQNAGGTFTSNSNGPITFSIGPLGNGFIGGVLNVVITKVNEALIMSRDSSVSLGCLTIGATALQPKTFFVGVDRPISTIRSYAGAGYATLSGSGATLFSINPTVVHGSLFSNGGLMQGSDVPFSLNLGVNPTTGLINGTSTAPWLPIFAGYATAGGMEAVSEGSTTNPVIYPYTFSLRSSF